MEKTPKAALQDALKGFPEPEGSDIQIFSVVALRSAHGLYVLPLRQTTIPDGLDEGMAVATKEALIQGFSSIALTPVKSLAIALSERNDMNHPVLKELLPRPLPAPMQPSPLIEDHVKELKLDSSGQFMFAWDYAQLTKPQPIEPVPDLPPASESEFPFPLDMPVLMPPPQAGEQLDLMQALRG